MHHTARTIRRAPVLAMAVRAQRAGTGSREAVLTGAQRRVARLRDDGEAGAQVVEYAMLGGVSAAACGALLAFVKNPDVLGRILQALIDVIVTLIQGWF